jgi:predicted HTH transcriptional regulator
MHVRELGSINNAIYRRLNDVGKTIATQELQQLVDQKILIQAGSKGRGVKYKMAP